MAKSKSPKVDPIFTDAVNEYGPLGNDTGADVLGSYHQWREAGNRPGQFLPHLLQAWEIGDYDWDDLDASVIVEEMQRSQQAVFERLTRDDLTSGWLLRRSLWTTKCSQKCLNVLSTPCTDSHRIALLSFAAGTIQHIERKFLQRSRHF